MVLVHQSSFHDHVMMDGVPTSVHLDLTELQILDFIRGPVEVDEPPFHSQTFDSLSQAAWVIVDDSTPEEKSQEALKMGSRSLGIKPGIFGLGVKQYVWWK